MKSPQYVRCRYMLRNMLIISVITGWCSLNVADEPASRPRRTVLEVTDNLVLDPDVTYGAVVIRKSGITIDGRGAWLVGNSSESGTAGRFTGTAISAEGVSNVTVRNVNAKGWETALSVRNGESWTIENNNFSDNFHDPEFGWGENGRRGGIVLENVRKSTVKGNKANRVWDACVLVGSNENDIVGNDFSHTSNTCLKLWTASDNRISDNVLSHGIRISPGEVHARDSTSVLIESGSNGNRFLRNDCTHGGDGIFIRVLNGWCSTDNYFEANDSSWANNNGFECWAPRNTFVNNTANHCSYGFWMGGSDQTRLIGNQASFNGLESGHHNSPHLPGNGHAGIVFMFGTSSHIVVRGNQCEGNNGAGIALIGDLDSHGKKWKAWHWIVEKNILKKNRWGLYAKHADWIVAAGNDSVGNTVSGVQLDGDIHHYMETASSAGNTVQPPVAMLNGPMSVKVGQPAVWDASGSTDPAGRSLTYAWHTGTGDTGDGKLQTGGTLQQKFDKVGFHRIGVNVTNGVLTELAWRDVYVTRDVQELGTESTADSWEIEDFHDRVRSNEQTSQAHFSLDGVTKLIGNDSLHIRIEPYAGFRAALTWPKSRDACLALTGKTKLTFWLKCVNADVTGWQGGPFIVMHGSDGQTCHIEPKAGRDLLREVEYSEAREGWRLFEIPLGGDELWQRDGDLPATAKAVSLAFDSWGAPPLQIWIDGLALE